MRGTKPDWSREVSPNVLAEVAEAVRLQEGEAGVREVLRAVHLLSPPATKAVSRQTGLPVPIVAAINNELRDHGILTRDRPVQLTAEGAALLERLGIIASVDLTCKCCHGLEITIPEELTAAVDQLRDAMSQAPAVDLALDQSHCTPETKVRRVLAMIRAGVLPGGSLLLVGDDDLISLAVGFVSAKLGSPLTRRLAVVDISTEILGFLHEQLSSVGLPAELVQHDLRHPLPTALRNQFSVAMTDPPYTSEGARLFLSRAVEGLLPGAGQVVFFSFGSKGPDEALQVQQSIIDLGLTTTAIIRNFNEYEGAGILGGVSHLQQLTTTTRTRSLPQSTYYGPLYTADMRGAARIYQCMKCGERIPVRPGSGWSSVGQLKTEGCPRCSGQRFRPLRLMPNRQV